MASVSPERSREAEGGLINQDEVRESCFKVSGKPVKGFKQSCKMVKFTF